MARCILILAALLAAAAAAPTEVETEKHPVPILSLENHQELGGKFDWSYEAGDGTHQEQSGELKGEGEEAGEAIRGSYDWTDPEGNKHSLKYVADENGFQPVGDDIPVGPPAPEYVAKSLEFIAAHPQPAENEVKQQEVKQQGN